MKAFVLLTALFFALPVMAQKWEIQDKGNSVKWTAVGFPGFVKISGNGGKAKGLLQEKDGKVYGKISVPLGDYKTGMDLRDEHLHEKYLETAKHPTAHLGLHPFPSKPGKHKFSGTLWIKGEKSEVTGEALVKNGKGGSLVVEASFYLKMDDYPAIGTPSWLGITVAEKVDVVALFTALRR